MIEELDRLRVERKVVRMLVIEKVDRVLVEAKGESLEKGNVVTGKFSEHTWIMTAHWAA